MRSLKASLVFGFLFLLILGQTACYRATPEQERIEVYFNHPLAGLPQMDRPGEQVGELKERLLELIGSAERSLHAAIYAVRDPEVISQLGEACKRGVKLRIVTEREEYNGQLESLSCLDLRLDQNERLMHDKFAIIDGEIVWTSSANWTEGSFYFDANNALAIYDRDLAQAYRREFDQMFRSSQFGPQKEDNNAEEFAVGGTEVEAYFPPGDSPRRTLLRLIGQAEERIDLAMFYYTDEAIHQALGSALVRGVRVRAIFDGRGFENFTISKMDELIGLGAGAVDASPGLIHHKYAVIDHKMVVSGSANWTRSGMDYNDEDLVVIRSPEIAIHYEKNFEGLYEDARRYDRNPTLPPRVTLKHYNTQDVLARIEWRPHLAEPPDRYELCRARESSGLCEETFEVQSDHWYFVDRTAEVGNTYYYRMRSILNGKWSDWSNQYVITAAPQECPSPKADEECDCDDRLDNDGDGHLDCDDYDCAVAVACASPQWPTIQPAQIITPVLSGEEVERDPERFVGKWATVRFYVVSTYDSGKAIFLDSSEDYKTDFTAVIFKSNEGNFLAEGIRPELDYDHRLIEVTGQLQEYNGPEIIVGSPAQVKILE